MNINYYTYFMGVFSSPVIPASNHMLISIQITMFLKYPSEKDENRLWLMAYYMKAATISSTFTNVLFRNINH